jgi:tetratricopeptide (TPR) repeat protein
MRVLLATFLALAAGCASGPSRAPVSEQPAQASEAEAAATTAQAEAVALMQAGELEQAEQILLMLHEDFPQYSGPVLNLAIVNRRLEREEQAMRFLQRALEINPANSAALNEMGVRLRQAGRFDEAADYYQQAIVADPSYGPAYLNYGILLDLYLDQPDMALAHYEQYFELSSGQDERVGRWIAELRLRIKSEQRTALVSP